jgi:lipopolysaccharide export system ATP-binding protein
MPLIKKFRIKNFKTINPITRLEGIFLSFDKRKVLENICIKLNPGEIVGLLGPNGAGKSTIFNLITGLIKPDSGKIIIQNNIVNDEPLYVRAKKYQIGYVPQYGGFLHDLTLEENLIAVGEFLITDELLRNQKIEQLIKKFSLEEVKKIKSKFLSGGQKRKLVISMALLTNPKILLCDEIFAALDVLTIQMLKEILVDLQNENPEMCIVICEHQAKELLSVVDRALILSNCNIVAEGSPHNLVRDVKAKIHYFGNNFGQ